MQASALETVAGLLKQFGPQIALSLASFVLGGLLGRLQAWRHWSRRAFYDRVTVSLNFVLDGQLQIRTLLERSSVDVFRNAHMLRRVLRAARRGDGTPLLALPDDDYWYYLNAVLNVISEQFAEGHVRQEAGLGPEAQTYLLFLTSERERPMRQQKIRAMLLRESLLSDAATLTPTFRNEFHQGRWHTLREVAREWADSQGRSPRIRRITLCV